MPLKELCISNCKHEMDYKNNSQFKIKMRLAVCISFSINVRCMDPLIYKELSATWELTAIEKGKQQKEDYIQF